MPIENPFGPDSQLRKEWQERMARRNAHRQQLAIHKKLLKLMTLGTAPTATGTALDLFELWGDPLDPARESFVRSCIAEFSITEGPILLSTATLMTLILGAMNTDDKNRTIWCLEQNAHWTNTLRTWVKRYSIKNTHIINSQLYVKGGMVRYRIAGKHLPKNIALVMCDSPAPSAGAALSTMLTVEDNLAPKFSIMSRKIRSDDGPLIKRWATHHQANVLVLNKPDGFAKVSRRHVNLASAAPGQKARFDVDLTAG